VDEDEVDRQRTSTVLEPDAPVDRLDDHFDAAKRSIADVVPTTKSAGTNRAATRRVGD